MRVGDRVRVLQTYEDGVGCTDEERYIGGTEGYIACGNGAPYFIVNLEGDPDDIEEWFFTEDELELVV